MEVDGFSMAASDVKAILGKGSANGYKWSGQIGSDQVESRHSVFSLLIERTSDRVLFMSNDPEGLCRIYNAKYPLEDGDSIFFVELGRV